MKADKLFKLIQSLNGAEKRYFSIWCTRHYSKEKNLTLVLFQDLSKLKEYDQTIFIENNKKKPYAKNFRFSKHFLFNQILKSLHAFHSGKNIESQLNEMLIDVDILSHKGLIKESREIIDAASALAKKYECFGIYYEVKRKELELFRESNFSGISKEQIEQTVREMKFGLIKANELADVESDVMQVMQSFSQSGLSRGESREQVVSLAEKLKPDTESEEFFRSTLLYFQGMGAVEFSKGNFEGALVWANNVLRLFSRFAHMKLEKKKTFVVAVQNQLIISSYLDRYEDLEITLKSLEEIKSDTPQLKNRIFYISRNMLLGTCAVVGDYNRAIKLIDEINLKHQSGEIKYLSKQQELIYDFTSALIFFGAAKFKEANTFINKLIEKGDEQHRGDLYSFAQIFKIIIQFEAGKQDLLEYSVRSAYRYFSKKKKLFQSEKVILEFLKKSAPSINTKQKQKSAFGNLYNMLLPLSKMKSEKPFFQFFDFITWLESKSTDKTMQKLLQAKHKSYWQHN